MIPLRIAISYPEPCLWPNRKDHHMVKAAATAAHRHEAKIETLRALDTKPFAWQGGDVRLTITGHKPADRGQDRTNLQAALKGAIDGIADALLVNDKHFVVTTEWGPMKPPRGGVTVEVSQ